VIIRSEYRQVGGLAAHLTSTEKNRLVRVEVELLRDCPTDIADTLALFVIFASTNARCRRDLLHLKISPGARISDLQLAQVLTVIEEEHGIPTTTPRHIVRHSKGDRADHFHACYAMVDPTTGRALDSSANYLKDEIASRRLELMFGERIVSGPRDQQVVEILRARGSEDDARRISEASRKVERGVRLTDGDQRQAARLKMDERSLKRFVNDVWTAFNNQSDFIEALTAHGLGLAQGDRAVMVVDSETSFAKPLHRTINAAAKAAGCDVRMRAADTAILFPDLPTLAERKRALGDQAVVQAEADVGRELQRLRHEAAIDDDKDEVAAANEREAQLEAERQERQRQFRDTLQERRRLIRAAHEERRKLRKRRVDRAFKLSGITGTKILRRAVFLAVTYGVLLAGGGLGWALIFAGVARAALPDRELARALAYEASRQNDADFQQVKVKLDDAFAELRAELRAEQKCSPAEELPMSAVRERVSQVAHKVRQRSRGIAD
jgi:hypothetical protein